MFSSPIRDALFKVSDVIEFGGKPRNGVPPAFAVSSAPTVSSVTAFASSASSRTQVIRSERIAPGGSSAAVLRQLLPGSTVGFRKSVVPCPACPPALFCQDTIEEDTPATE
jgi:hypothetical protein